MMLISQDDTIAVNTDLVTSFRLISSPYTVKAPTIFAYLADGSAVKIGEFKDEKTAQFVFERIILTTPNTVTKVPKTIKEETK